MNLTALAVLLSSFMLLLVIGVPIAITLGLASLATLLCSLPLLPATSTLAQRLATSLDSFALLAIPFFVLAGQLMNRGGIAHRLIELAKALVGRLPGGLAYVNIVACMLFGAISGSAVAAASAVGGIMAARMVAEGYPRPFSAAVNVTSATTGMIIPPSNILIIYSLAAGGVSVSALFVAGYLPGLLLGLSLMAVTAVIARRRRFPVGDRVPLRETLTRLLAALPSLLLLLVVIGGIVAGFFTATEASAIAVVYTLILALGYRELRLSDLPGILLETVKTTAVVTLLVGTSMGLSWVMSFEDLPQAVSSGLLRLSDDRLVLLLVINAVLLGVGVFMDMTPAVLIFTPIFLPVARQIGLHPLHFGIIVVTNLCIGLCTPPVGSVLFVGCGVAGVPIEAIVRPMLPLFLAMLVALLVITAVPGLSLWLPGLLGL